MTRAEVLAQLAAAIAELEKHMATLRALQTKADGR